MIEPNQEQLMEALGDVTYEDLMGDLERYGVEMDENFRECYPVISFGLVVMAMRMADECPVCLRRFVNLTGKHSDGCSLAKLIQPQPQ